jgi:hypothetical protein
MNKREKKLHCYWPGFDLKGQTKTEKILEYKYLR